MEINKQIEMFAQDIALRLTKENGLTHTMLNPKSVPITRINPTNCAHTFLGKKKNTAS